MALCVAYKVKETSRTLSQSRTCGEAVNNPPKYFLALKFKTLTDISKNSEPESEIANPIIAYNTQAETLHPTPPALRFRVGFVWGLGGFGAFGLREPQARCRDRSTNHPQVRSQSQSPASQTIVDRMSKH